MAQMNVKNIVIDYDAETRQVLKMEDAAGCIDFTDDSKLHPVKLYAREGGVQIVNTYAVEQQVQVGWQENLCGMLVQYLEAPAKSYRQIHNMVCQDSIARMRKILATYVSHLSRTDAKEVAEWVTKYLRVLIVLGNKDITDELEAAINAEDQLNAFVGALQPMMDKPVLVTNYIKMLELYFGYVQRDKVTYELLRHIPLKEANSREAPIALATWALENELIAEEQVVYHD